MIDPNKDPIFRFIGFVYFLLKLLLVACIAVAFGISSQCHQQVIEVCQLFGKCK